MELIGTAMGMSPISPRLFDDPDASDAISSFRPP